MKNIPHIPKPTLVGKWATKAMLAPRMVSSPMTTPDEAVMDREFFSENRTRSCHVALARNCIQSQGRGPHSSRRPGWSQASSPSKWEF